jgi:hypothetical protein
VDQIVNYGTNEFRTPRHSYNHILSFYMLSIMSYEYEMSFFVAPKPHYNWNSVTPPDVLANTVDGRRSRPDTFAASSSI